MTEMHLARCELDKEDIRLGFGKGLLEAGKRHENVVALCAGPLRHDGPRRLLR